MLLLGLCVLALISLGAARHRERSFMTSVNMPGFSGSDLRMYYVYTEMYRVVHILFTSIACYIVFDLEDHFRLAAIIGIIGGLWIAMRVHTIILIFM